LKKRNAVLASTALVLLAAAAVQAQTLVVTPNPLNLSAQIGGSPVTATLTFTSSDNTTAIPFSLFSAPTWISVPAPPAGGWTTPTTVTIAVIPSQLQQGNTSGSLVFRNGTTTVPITVNVTVSSISVTPTSINLGTYQAGSTIYPASQTLTVLGANGSFTVSKAAADTWYTAAAFGNPLSAVLIQFNSAAASSLTPSTTPLQGTLTITPGGSNPVPITVPINLTVTASPQVTVNPTAMVFNWQSGGTNNQTAQTLTLTSNSSQAVTITQASTQANWITLPSANPTVIQPNSSAQLTVVVNGTNQQFGAGNGTVQLAISGALFPNGTTQMAVPVTLNVSSSPVLYSQPPSLSYTYQFGTASMPGPQPITVTSSGAPSQQVEFTVSVSSAPWLVLSFNGQSIGSTTTLTSGSGSLTAAVTTAGLSPSTYNGTITITPAANGSAQPAVTIPVTLTVTFLPILNMSTSQMVFPYQVGQSTPAAQTVSLSSSTGAALSYTVTPPSAAAAPWLLVNGQNGVAVTGVTDQTSFSVSINTSGVPSPPPSSYLDATINVSATDPNTGAAINTVPIDVRLFASTTPILVVSPPGPLQFSTYPNAPGYPVASSCGSQPLCTISLNSTSPATGDILTITGLTETPTNPVKAVTGNWLGGTQPGPTTPTSFTLNSTQLSTTAMPPGTYQGSVTITANNSTGSPVLDASAANPYTFPVLFTVNEAKGFVTTQQPDGSIQFTATKGPGGGAPASQTVQVMTDGVSLPFSAVVNTGLLSWLTVSKLNGPTPGSFNVSADPSNLTTGTYHGAIYVTIPYAQGSPIRIPVTFTVNGGSISASPSSLTFTQILGGPAPTAQAVQITASPSAVSYTVATTITTPQNGTWLAAAITAGSGSTPGTVTVSVSPGSLPAGSYTGSVVITSAGTTGSPITIPVTLAVQQATISAPTTPLTFNQLAGGPAPTAQSVQVTATPGPVGFTVSTSTNTGSGWLTATVGSSGASGVTPATVQISVNGASLAAGPYSGVVTITSPSALGSPISIPVALNVGTAAVLTPSQTSLSFTAAVGQAAPSQTLTVTSSASAQFTVTATTKDGTNWLSASPTSGTLGTSPTTLTISANSQNLAAGSYSGTVTISSGSSISPVTINVSLTVQAIPTPVIGSVTNAASYVTGSVSPGENITIFGTGIGPAQLVGAALTAQGTLSTNVGSTQVTFDGIAAPILYASAKQTSVMVPYEIGGRATTNIQVIYSSVPSATLSYNVTAAVPGIYTLNQQGFGPGVILNPDGKTVNGPNTPAPAGSEIAIYMTGEGATTPASSTGGVAGAGGNTLNTPLLNVTATVAGLPATVAYKGSAPGIVYGVMQVNIVIPSNAPSGPQPLVINVGNNATQSGVTVQVQ